MTLLPLVDSLVFKTASYSESQAAQFFEVHEGESHFCNINNNNNNNNNNHNNSNNSKYGFIARNFHLFKVLGKFDQKVGCSDGTILVDTL